MAVRSVTELRNVNSQSAIPKRLLTQTELKTIYIVKVHELLLWACELSSIARRYCIPVNEIQSNILNSCRHINSYLLPNTTDLSLTLRSEIEIDASIRQIGTFLVSIAVQIPKQTLEGRERNMLAKLYLKLPTLYSNTPRYVQNF